VDPNQKRTSQLWHETAVVRPFTEISATFRSMATVRIVQRVLLTCAALCIGCGGKASGDPIGSASAGSTAAGGTSARTQTSGGAAGATGTGPTCDPFGRWSITPVDSASGQQDSDTCNPARGDVVVAPTADPEHPSVTFTGRMAGPATCYPAEDYTRVIVNEATLSDGGCTLTATYDASWCDDGSPEGERRTLDLNLADQPPAGSLTTIDSRCSTCWPDCPPRTVAVTATRVDGSDPELGACIARYDKCACGDSCQDGWNEIVFYRGSGSPERVEGFGSPSPELLEVAVAHHTCATCDCRVAWRVKRGDTWVGVGPSEFCAAILQYNRTCGDCLSEWHGGCC
jgi:hypothetical protein